MGRRIFFSYSSTDLEVATRLSDDLVEFGHELWRDQRLSGGQEWWDAILEEIRLCDVFLVALSGASLRSVPCKREREYAEALGKSILPVRISDDVTPNITPPLLASKEWVDYRTPDSRAAARLHRALETSPASPPLPDPLPEPPPVPLSYLSGIAAAITQDDPLSAEDQYALVFKLKEGLADPEDAHDAQSLLTQLRQRPEILAVVAREIDTSLAAGRPAPAPPGPPAAAAHDSPQRASPERGTKRGRGWIVVVGVGVLIVALIGIGLALRSDGDEGTTTSSTTAAPGSTAVTSAVSTATSSALGDAIDPLDAIASSVFEEPGCDEADCRYDPENLFDGDLSTAWAEGADGLGEGQSVTVTFPQPYRLLGFQVAPGWQRDACVFGKNGRPKTLVLTTEAGTSETLPIEDRVGRQAFEIDLVATEVTIAIDEVWPGAVCDGDAPEEDTLISEISFRGVPA